MYRPKRQPNKLLYLCLGIAAVVLLLVTGVLGGLTIYRFVQPPEPDFEPPPPLERIEPKKLEYQVKNQKRQKDSARPRQQRISVKAVSQIQVADVQIDVPTVPAQVAVGLGAGRGGSGAGIGGSGGVGFGKSAVDVFGIEESGERIVLIVDAARSMLDPRRGDLPGYKRVKDEVSRVVRGLNAGTLFNVFVFSDRLDVLSQRMLVANKANKDKVVSWIEPYWAFEGTEITGKKGAYLNNYQPELGERFDIRSGGSRMDLALVAAFEQRADAIFLITDGTPSIVREFNESERREYERRLREWEREGEVRYTNNELRKYEQAVKAWEERVAKLKEERRQKGLPPVVSEGNAYGNRPSLPRKKSPKPNDAKRVSDEEFIDWMSEMARQHYGDSRRDLPPLHVIGYSTNERTEAFINDLQRRFPGSEFREIGGFDKDGNPLDPAD
ncbi:MAG: hypothetical protein ACFE0O_05275 [Opitutales bacterium]